MSRHNKSHSGGLSRLATVLLLLLVATCASSDAVSKEDKKAKAEAKEEFDDDWDFTSESGKIIRVPTGYKKVTPNLNPPRAAPQRGSSEAAVRKLEVYKSSVEPLNALNVVVYDVQDVVASGDALQLTLNNIRAFATAVQAHSTTAPIKAFYLFNVASSDGDNPNPAAALLPLHLPNVAAVHWGATRSAFDTHLRSLALLDASGALKGAASIFCTGSSVRPLLKVGDGEWLADFWRLLESGGERTRVGIVGAEARCDGFPVALTHAFMLRPNLVRSVVVGMAYEAKSEGRLEPTLSLLTETLSNLVREQGYQVASMLHHVRYQQASPTCNAVRTFDKKSKGACVSQPEEVLLLHWSGASLGAEGFLCGKALGMSALRGRVQELTLAVGALSNSSRMGTGSGSSGGKLLLPVLPEKLVGGLHSALYAQYEVELARQPSPPDRDSKDTNEKPQNMQEGAPQPPPPRSYSADSSVCFLVRTGRAQDPQYVHKPPMQKYLHMGLDVLVQSLLAQTNPHWQAFFFAPDPQFDRRLSRILHRHADPRLVPLNVHNVQFRPKTDPKTGKTDGVDGYTITDYVLGQVIVRPECRWVSVSDGDNAYGSEVVERVLSAPRLAVPSVSSDRRSRGSHSSRGGSGEGGGGVGGGLQADMVLAPIDSRSLAQQDYLLRHDLDSDRRCLGIEAVLALSGLAYTASPVPKTVDMAAIFLRRDKLLTENVWFGNFSDAKRFHCLGCNGGYFTQYLVRNRGWTYTRLPIDGLRSAVFHGPSPTHCIAAGNVWFDHPREIRVGCLGHDAVQRMLRRDLGRQYGKPPLEPYFDWDHYNTSDRVCLRLSRYGAKSDLSMRRRLGGFQRIGQVGVQGKGGLRVEWKKAEVEVEVEEGELEAEEVRGEGGGGGGGEGVAGKGAQGGLYPSIRYRSHEEQWRQVQHALHTQNRTLQRRAHVHSYSRSHRRLQEPVEKCVWTQYMALNPDLATFITLAHAPSHFKSYGSKENRECLFDWKMYVQRNPDLEGVGITTEAQALDHYVNNGKKEGRVHSTAEERYKCDWRVYLLLNPDVAAAVSLPQAAAHYHQSGRSEGRECRFDYIQYLQLNLDLEVGGVKTEAQAVAHYLAQGKKENRIHSLESAPPSALVQCSARSYLLLNPDLQNIVPEAEAMAHYNTVGKGAKRECGFDWQQYLAYNTDVFGIRNETHALEHYLSKGRAEGRIFYAPAKAQGFEWMDYLEVNPDIDPRKEISAILHYNSKGRAQGRPHAKVAPLGASWSYALLKLDNYLRTNGAKHGKQNLVVYNIEDVGYSDVALALTLNNVRTFVTAILHHVEAEGGVQGAQGGVQKAFYLVNIAARTDNPALPLLAKLLTLPNVGVVHWTYSSSSLNTFLRTLHLLGADLTSILDAIFHLNSGVRGPLAQYQGGKWISQYRELLDAEGVGLVGSMIDCHKTPYVQPHAFALRGSLVYSLLQEVDKYHSSLVFVPLEDYFRFRLTALVQEQGERVASLQHSRQTGLGFFTSCPIPYRDSKGSTGSSSSSTSGTGSEAQAGLDCDVDPEVVLFLRWSGEAMGAPDFLCGKAVAMNAAARAKVAQLTLALAKTPLSLAAPPLPSYLLPTLPEAATGFIMYEEWGKETAMSWPPAPSGWPGRKALLCVAVLVGGVGGGGVSGGGGGSFGPPLKQASLLDTVQSLQQQQNPNWRAFLLPEPGTYPSLAEALESDLRVGLLELGGTGDGDGDADGHRHRNDGHGDSGKGAEDVLLVRVDEALRHMAGRPECLWVSAVRQGDMYGSGVVASVLSAAPMPLTARLGGVGGGDNGGNGGNGGGGQAAMLLAPLDSHKYAVKDSANRLDFDWDRGCLGLEASLDIQGTYVKKLAPRVGDFDLAGAFMQSSWLGREALGLANFSRAAGECARAQRGAVAGWADRAWMGLGCAAEQLAQHLVRGVGVGGNGSSWTYAHLPQDALRSVVFQAPSPTRCVAQGDLWLDHPCPAQAGCLSHLEALRLWRVETAAEGQNETQTLETQTLFLYDWGKYWAGSQVCLRLSQFGFHAQKCRL